MTRKSSTGTAVAVAIPGTRFVPIGCKGNLKPGLSCLSRAGARQAGARETVVIGIDPGARGALAVLPPRGAAAVQDFSPDVLAFLAGFHGAAPEDKPHVFLEWVIPVQKLMPSVVGAYKMGCAFGELVGALKAARVPYTLVRPRQWQRVMLAGTPASLPTKARARLRAVQLFPDVILVGPRGGYRDGRADALLIGEWGRRLVNGGGA